MIIRLARFNSYFWLALLAAASFAGCQTESGGKSKQIASLRVHLQATDDRLEHSVASVYRAAPIKIPIENTPFLTELNVADAKVVEAHGVIAMVIKLDQKGAWILENYTGANPGRHFPIFTQYGDKAALSRWLAAPVIQSRITDGILSFTPDATREECEQIVEGLRNFARKEGNLPTPSKE